ncbi:MAG: hypothetical protein ACRDNB_12865 [Gaiellaceae bacterium]
MHLTNREIWALVHGMLIGGPLLLGYAVTLTVLAGLRSDHLTARAIGRHVAGLRVGAGALALSAWAVVLLGTWVLLPWYREDTPDSPQSVLLSDPSTRQWHEFADVWKTHVAVLSPILATAGAALVLHYGGSLARDRTARAVVFSLFLGAFAIASLAADRIARHPRRAHQMKGAPMQHEIIDQLPANPSPSNARDARETTEPLPASGPAAAAVFAAGLAALTLGSLSMLSAASTAVADALTVYERSGDASGLITVTAAVFFASWAALAAAWRRADPPLARVAAISGIFVLLGLLGTFPPFFNAFGG